jgi:hypothetical protein
MNARTILLAEQLLDSVPKVEMPDLIRLLEYYNRFPEGDRVKAMRYGSTLPADRMLEESVAGEIRATFNKSAGHLSYITTNQSVCRCCGR